MSAEQVRARFISADFFSVLGVNAGHRPDVCAGEDDDRPRTHRDDQRRPMEAKVRHLAGGAGEKA